MRFNGVIYKFCLMFWNCILLLIKRYIDPNYTSEILVSIFIIFGVIGVCYLIFYVGTFNRIHYIYLFIILIILVALFSWILDYAFSTTLFKLILRFIIAWILEPMWYKFKDFIKFLWDLIIYAYDFGVDLVIKLKDLCNSNVDSKSSKPKIFNNLRNSNFGKYLLLPVCCGVIKLGKYFIITYSPFNEPNLTPEQILANNSKLDYKTIIIEEESDTNFTFISIVRNFHKLIDLNYYSNFNFHQNHLDHNPSDDNESTSEERSNPSIRNLFNYVSTFVESDFDSDSDGESIRPGGDADKY